MNNEKWFSDKLDKFKDDVDFLTEEAILEFTEKIVCRMEEIKMSRSEFAEKLGVSKAFITKLLNGNPNLTIKTMVSIAKALNCKLELALCPSGFEARRFLVPKKDNNIFSKFRFIKNKSICEGNDAVAA